MTGYNFGGSWPILWKAGDLTPGMMILLAIVILIAAAVVITIVRVRMNGARHLELTVKAKVAVKRETGSRGDCRVSFELPEGETKSFHLTAAEADALTAGAQGMLTYKGARFLQFVPN